MTEENYLILLKIIARCYCFNCSFEVGLREGGVSRACSPAKASMAPCLTCSEGLMGILDGNYNERSRLSLGACGLCSTRTLHPASFPPRTLTPLVVSPPELPG